MRLAPQKDWQANNPERLTKVLSALEQVQKSFNGSQSGGKKVSLADLIVLAGCAGVEKAAAEAGHPVTVPFEPGRTDATVAMTDGPSFDPLEPKADGFRNYQDHGLKVEPAVMLVDKAQSLTLTVPEMTVLVGGMRTMNCNTDGSELGVLTDRPGTLSNDFFVNLLDQDTVWKKSKMCEHFYEGRDGDQMKWRASSVDLVFGSNSQLRAICEVYASEDAKEKFVRDFVAAWDKVMNLDRFDLDPAYAEAAKVAIR